MSDIAVAAILAATILVASTISIEVGLSVALIELLAGFVVGNALNLSVPSWLSFIGTFASVVLTFLAGAEVDVPRFRARVESAGLDRPRLASSHRSPSSGCSPITGSGGITGRPRSQA